jgi:hypothetical protein
VRRPGTELGAVVQHERLGFAEPRTERERSTNHIRFSTCSTTLPAGSRCGDAAPAIRSYASFSQAAKENGRSRILVGYHFREGVKVGIDHGSKIGRWTVKRSLQLVRHRHHDRRGHHDGDDRGSK